MYLVIRISTPFLFNFKQEALDFIDSELANSNILESKSFSLWFIHGENLEALNIDVVRENLSRGWHL